LQFGVDAARRLEFEGAGPGPVPVGWSMRGAQEVAGAAGLIAGTDHRSGVPYKR